MLQQWKTGAPGFKLEDGSATGEGGHDGVATGEGATGEGGHDGVAAGEDGGRRWNINEGKLYGLPSSFDIGISMLIFGFLIKFLDLSRGAVAVLTFCCWGAGGGGETGTATRL